MTLKTHKATSKRFKLTKSGKKKCKVMKRTAGQNHFNTRENGKVGRNKKSDKSNAGGKALVKTIKTLLGK